MNIKVDGDPSGAYKLSDASSDGESDMELSD